LLCLTCLIGRRHGRCWLAWVALIRGLIAGAPPPAAGLC